MGLSVQNYLANKTVKLSDAYTVYLESTSKYKYLGLDSKYPGATDVGAGFGVFLQNVVEVKLPSLPVKSDSKQYGTVTRNYFCPDFEAAPMGLTISLFETSDHKVQDLINYILSLNGPNEMGYGTFEDPCDPTKAISKIEVSLLDNNLSKVLYKYVFGICSITDYSYNYEYDYRASSLPLVTITFAYRTMSLGEA